MLRPPENKKIITWLIIALSLLLVFIIWIVFIAGNQFLDERVFSAIAPHINARRTGFMKAVSFLGNHNFLIPANLLLVFYFISRKDRWAAVTASVVAISSVGLLSLLKNSIGRHRPPDPLVQGITNFSFPSGHAFMSVAFYGMLIWWITNTIKIRWQRITAISFFVLLILTICFSRIYLRVHYTSDIIAGLCIGTAWLVLSLMLMDMLKRKYFGVKQ